MTNLLPYVWVYVYMCVCIHSMSKEKKLYTRLKKTNQESRMGELSNGRRKSEVEYIYMQTNEQTNSNKKTHYF